MAYTLPTESNVVHFPLSLLDVSAPSSPTWGLTGLREHDHLCLHPAQTSHTSLPSLKAAAEQLRSMEEESMAPRLHSEATLTPDTKSTGDNPAGVVSSATSASARPGSQNNCDPLWGKLGLSRDTRTGKLLREKENSAERNVL